MLKIFAYCVFLNHICLGLLSIKLPILRSTKNLAITKNESIQLFRQHRFHASNDDEISSTAASLASIVERSFIVACSDGDYIMGLNSFISSIMKAYDRGYTVSTLSLEIAMCTNNSAGRALYPDEIELRTVWMTLVYLTLERARWPQSSPCPPGISDPFKNKFYSFVGNIMEAHAKGYDLKRLKLEEMLRSTVEPRNEFEVAVLSQSMRIVFMTLDLMSQGWEG